MCQMCDEYESELVRMGLIEDAKAFREEREREHGKAVAATVERKSSHAESERQRSARGASAHGPTGKS